MLIVIFSDICQDDEIPAEMKDTQEYEELKRLLQLHKHRVLDEGQHVGYKVCITIR